MQVEVVFAFNAPPSRVGCAIAVFDLAFVMDIEEEKSVAVRAVSLLAEIPAVVIGVLANSRVVHPVPLHTLLTSLRPVN